MNCPQCKTRNPIGNKYCRECGARVTPSENPMEQEEVDRVEEERLRERVASLLATAFTLSEQNKAAEALPMAEEAAHLLPTSTAAHALLATLYERAEQFDRAIAAMEKVVALNPDSAVDRDKLERMRRGVHLLPRRAPAPAPTNETWRKWGPRIAGVGVAALVIGIGVSLGNRTDHTPTPRLTPLTPPGETPSTHTPAPQNDSPAVARPFLGSPPAGAGADPFEHRFPTMPSTGNPASLGTSNGNERGGSDHASSLPRPGAGTVAQDGAPVAPVTVLPQTGGNGNPLGSLQTAGDDPAGFGSGERIRVGPPTENSKESEPSPEPENPGSISIKIGPSRGGSRDSGSPDNAQTSLLKAQSFQEIGKFREAIAAYRDALMKGANAGEAYQGIARCYQRLGEDAAARTAYQQAISAYEAQVRSGRGALAQHGLSSCRAALETLGG